MASWHGCIVVVLEYAITVGVSIIVVHPLKARVTGDAPAGAGSGRNGGEGRKERLGGWEGQLEPMIRKSGAISLE